jgi:formate dehydrogenase subunit delta
MHNDYLVQMANDIAAFFVQGGTVSEDAAAQETFGHIRRFWEPRMRSQIIAMHPKATGDLTPVAQRAIELLSQESTATR